MAKADRLARLAPRATIRQVYDDLHGKIVRGELPPGETLSESRVADLYGLSRTPVREVFWRLGEDGLLRVVPQVGTFVAPINISAVYDSQFVRETLECRAVLDAAIAARPDAVEEMRAILNDQTIAVRAGDFASLFTLDDALHRSLMTMAGRPFVWHVIAGAKAQLDRVRFLSLEDQSWANMILDQHRGIVDCVATHDKDGAVRLMSIHLRTAFAAIGRIAEQHPAFFEGSVEDQPAHTRHG